MTKRRAKHNKKRVESKIEVPKVVAIRPKFRVDAKGIDTLGAGLQIAEMLYKDLDRMSLAFYSDRDGSVDASILLDRFTDVNNGSSLTSFKVQGAYLREDGWQGNYDEDLKHLCKKLIPILEKPNAEMRGYDCFIRTEGDHYTNFEMKDVQGFLINLARTLDDISRSKVK